MVLIIFLVVFIFFFLVSVEKRVVYVGIIEGIII